MPGKKTTSAAEARHVDWLSLLRPDGPFLSPTVLAEVFDGPVEVGTATAGRVRQGWEELADQPDLLAHAWIEYVLTDLLRYRGPMLARDAEVPAELRGGPGRAPYAVAYGPDPAGGRAPRMLIYRIPWGDAIGDLTDHAIRRAKTTGVPLALITDGRLWRIVHARRDDVAASHATFDADLWLEERVLLRAFVTLLDSSRVLPPPTDEDGAHTGSLAALFARTAEARDKLTADLGEQVRQAVELLVAELARLDREAGGDLLRDVPEREIYRGALTVMMRLVFCLYAEERRLLPVDSELYVTSYAVSGLYAELAAHRSAFGGEVGDRRSSAWPRLMATFAAIHGGCQHDLMRVRPYGGSLFDPDRTAWMAEAAVTDRVVFEILNALLRLHRQGRAAEPISYKGLDVEQIGHIYEGLLEFACVKTAEPHVGLVGNRSKGKDDPELPLAELERAAAEGDAALAAYVIEKTGRTPKQVAADLKKTPKPEDEGNLHAACDNDEDLTARVRPFYGLLRNDLRGHPVVFPPGSVMFTQTGDRRETGTHYTPAELADEVVRHTLDPLCHNPGPAEGASPDDWRVRPADALLNLKVLDPACGSAAFLVAACRYLGERVVEAWRRDGVPDDVADAAGPDCTEDDLRLEARRRVAARCLHGVDRDDMAIELAKLSLWLVTLSKDKPFSFLDHALRVGDSLVGLLTADQVAAFHFDPAEGRAINHTLTGTIDEQVTEVLAEVTRLRAEIEDHPSDTIADIERKQALLDRADRLTHRLRFVADTVVGAALSTAVKPEKKPWEPEPIVEHFKARLKKIADPVMSVLDAPDTYTYPELRISVEGLPWHQDANEAEPETRTESLGDRVREWLTGSRPEPVHPLHWALEFPEVMRGGGFDAVVSNPPFSGGQRLTGNLGKDTREYWIEHIARGKRGSADMSAYFLLRDLDLAKNSTANGGRVGIIATNTIAQGDTREVGLDQVAKAGRTVFRAVKSQPWPNKANVHVSLVWAGNAGEREQPVLDHHEVSGITPSLDTRSRVSGNPKRLTANEDQAFQGSNVLGKGFLLEPQHAKALIEKDPRNKDVLFPYLNGDDLNSSPSRSASRWIINFHDWPQEKAAAYPDCFEIVDRHVRPERERITYSKNARERWWLYERRRPELYEAIGGMEKVLVIAQTSSTQMPAFVPNGQVFDQKLVVFADSSPGVLAFRASCFQREWTARQGSTMKADIVYTPSDCCETLPIPSLMGKMRSSGEELVSLCGPLMIDRQIGLTSLYNLVHDPACHDEEIQQLRALHVEIDEAVKAAYAADEEADPGIQAWELWETGGVDALPTWRDIDLDYGFHETRQGVRFTIGSQARVDVLDKLLSLNHYRWQQEEERGEHKKKPAKRRKKTSPAASRTPSQSSDPVDGALFEPPDTLF